MEALEGRARTGIALEFGPKQGSPALGAPRLWEGSGGLCEPRRRPEGPEDVVVVNALVKPTHLPTPELILPKLGTNNVAS